MLDARALAAQGQAVQMVPRDLVEHQMERQETIQNVNIAFSVANSDTIFKHAIDGSAVARECIQRSLTVLVLYLRGIQLDGKDVFEVQVEAPPDESGAEPAGAG